MMLRVFIFIGLSAITCSQVIAEKVTRINVYPIITSHFGETEYEFFQEFRSPSGAADHVRSLLEYPLNYSAAGIGFALTVLHDNRPEWRYDLSVLRNITDPRGLMKDHDWLKIAGIVNGKVSFTESDSDIGASIVDFEIQRLLAAGKRIEFSLLFGLTFQRFEQNMVGFEGWQLDTNNVKLLVSGTDSALFYRITWFVPQVGVGTRFRLSRLIGVDTKLAFGLPFFFDKDRHLLRNFETTADGIGWGITSRLATRYDLSGGNGAGFIELTGELITVRGNTNKKQTFYGDDPGTTSIDETGLSFSGIPHTVRSTQFRAGIRFGFAL